MFQTNALRHSTVPVWHSDTSRSHVVRRGPDRRPSAVQVPARRPQLPAMLSSVPRQSRDETNASWVAAFLRLIECSAVAEIERTRSTSCYKGAVRPVRKSAMHPRVCRSLSVAYGRRSGADALQPLRAKGLAVTWRTWSPG